MNASLSIKENELQDKAEPLQEGFVSVISLKL